MIKFKNISFQYNEDEPIIKDVSFTIKKGSYTCIVGHNGSGKSTIAKLLIGLLEASEGEIIVDNIKLEEKNLDEIRNICGIVFQNPDNQFIGTTVEDDIAFTLENANVEQEKMRNIIETYAQKVGMENYLQQEPTHLSGGQKQRVALASVLAGNSRVIILDEATSMLDPQGKQEIMQLIKQIFLEKEITIISITHDMEEVLSADHVIVLENGQKIMDDIPKNIFAQSEKLKQLKLKLPFILEVKAIAKEMGYRVDDTYDLKEVVEQLWQSK